MRAYRQIAESGILSKRRLQVAWVVADRGPVCSRCAWEVIHEHDDKIPQHSINPRFVELEANEIIRSSGTHTCPYTGKTTQRWVLTGIVPLKWKQPKRVPRDQLLHKIGVLEEEIRVLHATLQIYKAAGGVQRKML